VEQLIVIKFVIDEFEGNSFGQLSWCFACLAYVAIELQQHKELYTGNFDAWWHERHVLCLLYQDI
jgi:hypothetical protein